MTIQDLAAHLVLRVTQGITVGLVIVLVCHVDDAVQVVRAEPAEVAARLVTLPVVYLVVRGPRARREWHTLKESIVRKTRSAADAVVAVMDKAAKPLTTLWNLMMLSRPVQALTTLWNLMMLSRPVQAVFAPIARLQQQRREQRMAELRALRTRLDALREPPAS